jgi:hypothetical protein
MAASQRKQKQRLLAMGGTFIFTPPLFVLYGELRMKYAYFRSAWE